MMDHTDRFFRYLLRLISKHTLLYTEMLTTAAIMNGNTNKLLLFDEIEHPIALQLGGSSPKELAICARRGEDAGYDEINLNCGCPSERVQMGKIGACLMKTPQLVADCIAAMLDRCTVPITVKNRIGVDEFDSYQHLRDFVGCIADVGCRTFIVHARKAWLQGLSPKENREIPPLQYQLVYQLKQEFPHLEIILNGGITTLESIEKHLALCDGAMIGREVCRNPYMLSDIDRRFYNTDETPRRREEVLEAFMTFAHRESANGIHLKHISRHAIGLFNGQPGARQYRRYLSENARLASSSKALFMGALRAGAPKHALELRDD